MLKATGKTTFEEKVEFSFVIYAKIAAKPTIHQNLGVSKVLLGKFQNQ